MESFKFFKLYNAINLHMRKGSTYDFFKYGGNTKASESSFSVRRDKYFFEKLAKVLNDDSAVEFIFANFVEGNMHISAFTKEAYLKLRARRESLKYNFENFLDFYNKELSNDVKSLYNYVIANQEDHNIFLDFIILDVVLDGLVIKLLEEKYLNSDEQFVWIELLKERFVKIRPFIADMWVSDECKKSMRNSFLQHLKTYK